MRESCAVVGGNARLRPQRAAALADTHRITGLLHHSPGDLIASAQRADDMSADLYAALVLTGLFNAYLHYGAGAVSGKLLLQTFDVLAPLRCDDSSAVEVVEETYSVEVVVAVDTVQIEVEQRQPSFGVFVDQREGQIGRASCRERV